MQPLKIYFVLHKSIRGRRFHPILIIKMNPQALPATMLYGWYVVLWQTGVCVHIPCHKHFYVVFTLWYR